VLCEYLPNRYVLAVRPTACAIRTPVGGFSFKKEAIVNKIAIEALSLKQMCEA
jgi:hypothetical protein